MNQPLGTLVQKWPRGLVICVWGFILSLHCLMFVLGALLAPQMFHEAHHEGTSCQQPKNGPPTWYSNSTSTGNCIPLQPGERAALGRVITSFRFPRAGDEVSSYSIWNWKLTASLMLDVTFYTKQNIPEPFETSVILLNDSLMNDPENVSSLGNNNAPGFTIGQRLVPTVMRANLDSAPMLDFAQTSENKSGWKRDAQIYIERDLECTLSTSYNNSLVQDMDMTAQYICSLNPFLNLHFPENNSNIITLEFMPRKTSELSPLNQIESKFFDIPADINAFLTLIVEDGMYHSCIFYMKCAFTPFVVTALLWFCIRMYLNDLFISIPDRLLITSALALFVQNIPCEVIASQWPEPYVKLLDEMAYLALTCSLLLFWVVYTKDKLAQNEPWERNTKYYWRQMFLIVFTVLVAALFVMYLRSPTYQNPFKNHWQAGTTVIISLTFIFGLAISAMIYQTYLSILICKVICDVSIQYPCLERVWRIKMVLLYCFFMSVLTVGGFVLQLAIQLGLNWNPQFYMEPVPFYLSYSSPMLIGLQGAWNIHVITLLILLSRSKRCLPDYIRPVKYTRQGSYSVEANINHCSSSDKYPSDLDNPGDDKDEDYDDKVFLDEPMPIEEAIHLWEIGDLATPQSHEYIWKAHPEYEHNGYQLAMSSTSPLPEEEVH
ncbi:hypothetical protein TCAL_00615 [Tigriopus californicus]|uniref:Protein wntless n=1 Tax=Tigriopus californicus TaxID=6832 RepID=A0A553PDU4_TIGCA|nr:protein wntless-like [Tigriopus californicus]TRY75853.1 hypothetical protein TCAL_00615 [Tigriopus californicus]